MPHRFTDDLRVEDVDEVVPGEIGGHATAPKTCVTVATTTAINGTTSGTSVIKSGTPNAMVVVGTNTTKSGITSGISAITSGTDGMTIGTGAMTSVVRLHDLQSSTGAKPAREGAQDFILRSFFVLKLDVVLVRGS